ncbi:MAG TPA: VWA domain-containing protein [Bryobacteraceae bacterium]|nr:VWA domain-containing protein [Bryobacteraceae bacterium]
MAKTTPRPFTRLAAGVALLAGLQTSAGQAPKPPGDPAQAEISVSESTYAIRSQVTLVSVPVVVRDAQGHPIGSLSRDDFKITDNGKLQAISDFSVEEFGEPHSPAPAASAPKTATPTSAAAPPMPERFVALFFDDLNMDPPDLANAREAALRYIQNSMRPSERIAILSASGLTALDFTADRERLRQALLALHLQEAVVQNGVDCPPMTVYEADLIANSNDSVALGTAVADYLACSNSSSSAAEAAYPVFQIARMQANLADRNIRRELTSLDGLLRKMSGMAGQRVIVMASSGFHMLDERRQDELEILERAIRSGVVVNTLDARGLFASIPGGHASERSTPNTAGLEMRGFIGGAGTYSSGAGGGKATGNSSVSQYGASTAIIRDSYVRQEALAKRAILAEVASATGGQFFENSNSLDAGMARLAATPEYLYVLGFSPRDIKSDGKFHSLKVSLLESRGLAVEARKGYWAPLVSTDPRQPPKQIEEAVFSRGEVSDIPVDVQTRIAKTSADKATLSVAAKVDLGKVSFRKEQGRNKGDLTVVTGVFDNNGNYVSGVQKVFNLRLRDETLHSGPGLTVRNTFELPPGVYLVRLVVRDSASQTVSSKNTTVEIR